MAPALVGREEGGREALSRSEGSQTRWGAGNTRAVWVGGEGVRTDTAPGLRWNWGRAQLIGSAPGSVTVRTAGWRGWMTLWRRPGSGIGRTESWVEVSWGQA